jgi:RNA polymerase sigma-70 factor, ECF subfamily
VEANRRALTELSNVWLASPTVAWLAYLSSRTRDVGSAEDALSNALVAALETWPRAGVPQNPEAWLLTTACRSFIDLVRHRQLAEASEPTLALLREDPRT